jgi:NADH dehydrogenase
VAAATDAGDRRPAASASAPILTIKGHPEIFVVAIAAVQPWKKDKPTPGVARARSGRDVRGEDDPPAAASAAVKPLPLQRSRGPCGVGRLSGVTNIRGWAPFGRQGGFTAWLLWLGIHLVYLIGSRTGSSC